MQLLVCWHVANMDTFTDNGFLWYQLYILSNVIYQLVYVTHSPFSLLVIINKLTIVIIFQQLQKMTTVLRDLQHQDLQLLLFFFCQEEEILSSHATTCHDFNSSIDF